MNVFKFYGGIQGVVTKTIIPQLFMSILIGGISAIAFDSPSVAQTNNGAVNASRLNPQQQRQLSNLLNQGRKYLKQGDLEKALTSYRQASILDQSNPKIFSSIGYLYTSTKNYPAATQAYQKAVSLAPENADFLYGLGYSLAQIGKNAQAINIYKQAIKLKPNNIDSLVTIGVLLVRNGDYEEVQEYFDRIIALDAKQESAYTIMGKSLYKQQKNTQAISFLTSALNKFPQNQDLRLMLATTYLREKSLDKGLEQLKMVDSSKPNNPQIILKMGIIYEQLENYPLALSAYEKASALDNKSLIAYGGIARILEKQESDFQAIIAYRRFIELSPNNPYGYHRLGLLLQKRGRNGEAETILKQAQSLYQVQGKLEKVAEIQKKL